MGDSRPTTGRQRLSRTDWADAALGAIRVRGLPSVAVKPLARSLGVTQGSFYWHFDSRDDLIEAALERWEELGTTAVIDAIEGIADPRERLHALVRAALILEMPGEVEAALTTALDDRRVATAMARVTARRIDYLLELFGELGFDPEAARRRAVLTYSLYAGIYQLTRTLPELEPQTEELDAFADDVVAFLAGG